LNWFEAAPPAAGDLSMTQSTPVVLTTSSSRSSEMMIWFFIELIEASLVAAAMMMIRTARFAASLLSESWSENITLFFIILCHFWPFDWSRSRN
jgi:hypothetical protein